MCPTPLINLVYNVQTHVYIHTCTIDRNSYLLFPAVDEVPPLYPN